jgi:hypothetical protein
MVRSSRTATFALLSVRKPDYQTWISGAPFARLNQQVAIAECRIRLTNGPSFGQSKQKQGRHACDCSNDCGADCEVVRAEHAVRKHAVYEAGGE